MNKQLGLGLSELLISLFLASLLSTILIQSYLLNKRHYMTLRDSLAVNVDLLWVQDLLSDSIRRAGFTPCLSIDQLQAVDRRIHQQSLSSLTIEEKAQVVQIKRMSEQFSELLSFNKQEILISPERSLRVKQAIVIADCERAEVHQIVQINRTAQGSLLTLDSPIFFSYPSLSYVGHWLEERWFIKKNQEGLNALYYQQVHSEELTPVIHSMKIKQNVVFGKKKIDLAFGLANKKMHHFSVLVRS